MTKVTNLSRPGAQKCTLIFGGSFDPVHVAHVALADLFCKLFFPAQLRIIPTGWPSHKAVFFASPDQRIDMLSLAFAELSKKTQLVIDKQEIRRAELGIPSYSVDTLAVLREEFGPVASLILLIGADQLHQLHQWHKWLEIFNFAHVVVAARPGFTLNAVNSAVAREFKRRAASINQLQHIPSGHTLLWSDLAINISSTQIRDGNNLSLVPPDVLNYIQQHHIY